MCVISLYQLLSLEERAVVSMAAVPDVPIEDLKVSDISKLYACIRVGNVQPVPAVEVLMLRSLLHRQEDYINKMLVQQSKP